MLRFLFLILWLCSSSVFALNVAEQKTILTNLQQPVAVSLNSAGVLTVLDGNGLNLSTPQGQSQNAQVPASTLDLFLYKEHWFAADPVAGELLRINDKGVIEQRINIRSTLDSKQSPEPVAIAIYQDIIFWADRANHRVCRYD